MKYFLGETQEGTKINCEINSGKLKQVLCEGKRKNKGSTRRYKGV